MGVNYIPAQGELIEKNDLKISKAIELANAIEKLPFYSLVECRRLNKPIESEVIVFGAEIEVPQRIKHDIRNIERIAVIFSSSDDHSPEILALREDFPLIPHLNFGSEEKPRSLCLYDETFDEIKLHWTAPIFLEHIRRWLALTAKGELHAIDQPLESYLSPSSENLIIPFDLFKTNEDKAKEDSDNRFMIIKRHNSEWVVDKDLESFIAIPFKGKPQISGIIHRKPKNVFELHEFLKSAKIDLLSDLRNHLKNFEGNKDAYNTRLVLIVYLPKKRSASSEPESPDIWAFLVSNTIKEIGKEIGIWDIRDNNIAYIIGSDLSKKGENLKIDVLNPMPAFSREIASLISGLSNVNNLKLVLIGAGALGSQIFLNLIRMGFGNWTIIDDDCLLPHNLSRHALSGYYFGASKAKALAEVANNIIQGQPIAKAIVANVLHPYKSSEDLNQTYKEAQVIIDVSTSIPVARHLARDIDTSARRISMFLNPSGSDVVILSEDKDRKITLDCLEMQYYRYLINEPSFENHLISEGSIRYARSCGDVSSTIPQDLVALHSAICGRELRNLLSQNSASISIWRANFNDLCVKGYNIPIYEVIEKKFNVWTLCFDQWVLDKILKVRKEKLPNETGGVLIGAFDMQRKIIYVVDTILSPPDSIERPTSYIRGCQGLKHHIDAIQKITLGRLEYLGEWHSHPKGASTSPSKDDENLFVWLIEIMELIGLPPLMLIAGEHSHSWDLREIK